MKFYLIVTKGKKKGLPIPIEIDLFVIGSGKMCQLRAIHEAIGVQHCALVTREKKIFIRDLDSGQATILNGEVMSPGEEWPIHGGDQLEVGPLNFVIQFREKALSQRDLEEWALSCLDMDAGRKITAVDLLEQTETSSGIRHADAASAASAILDQMQAQKGIVKGRLRISREDGITVVRVNDVYLVEEGELTMIKKELHENLNRPNLKILIDLKNVRRMSSTAAEMFGELRQWLRPFGNTVVFCRVRSDIKEMLNTFPATSSIKQFDDKASAMAAKW